MDGRISKLRDCRTGRVGTILLAAAFVLHQPLSTATITVGGGCTLDDAISSANSDTATGGCSAGAGADTIELTDDVTLLAALPAVTADVVFEGNDHTITRAAGAADFRILELDLGGSVELRDIAITNGAADDGGGIKNNAGSLTLFNATITGNEATNRGGGIYGGFDTFNFLMQASTVADNTAALGGGLYTGFGSFASIESSTISGNSATEGGGVYAYPAFTSASVPEGHYTDLNLTNTLIANNAGGNCAADFQHDLGGNFDDDGSCLGASPVVAGIDFDANLANNGGPTLTHALLPASAAIDSGGVCGLAEDQRGFSRNILCDSGSVEFAAAPVGGSIGDARGINASCRNNNTGVSVSFPLGTDDDWNCEAQGLAVSTGEVITQSVQGLATDGAGGTVIGLAAERVSCRNTTTGQFVNLSLSSGPSWDCVAAGLVVGPGDRIRMVSRGVVP